MMNPYRNTTCHNEVAKALASRPRVSSAPPISTILREPSRSTIQPTSGELIPLMTCDTE